jgi:uncharacterized protein involved in exopolysaccharide biosynthesis
VIKTKNQIEQLKRRMSEAPKSGGTPANAQATGIEPPAIQQLRARVRQDDLSIADLVKRQGQIQNQIGVLQGRIQSTPGVEQQFKELTRNYQSAVEFYNDLLKRHDQAKIGRDLNRRQEGEQFRVLDAPSLPMSPSFPKKTTFAGAGFGGGLALGLAILFLLIALDRSMHTEHDVEVCLRLPVLATVPSVAAAGREQMNNTAKEGGLKLGGTGS